MLPTITLPRIDTGTFSFGSAAHDSARANYPRWDTWLHDLFPDYVSKPFGERHRQFWAWIDRIKAGKKPAPFVAIWPRGGAKSTSAELACIRFGYQKTRSYIWYVSSTQDKADKHVDTIGSMLESREIERNYPALASRKVGKYGSSKGWRRNRLRTSSGLTIDALGLDTGSRGGKVENKRPDLIIFDDVDEKMDSLETINKKIDTITTSVLPAGSNDCAVLFIQNLIHPNSIASKLADNTADFLIDRIVSGPFPAIDGLAYELHFDDTIQRNRYHITAGTATWEGQDVATCEAQINEWGISAFLKEAQHNVEVSGGIWDHIEFRQVEYKNVPKLVRGCVWCDPAVTSNDGSCANGIQADGLGSDGNVYRFFSYEQIDTPTGTIKRAINKAVELRFTTVGVETNQGGDTWDVVFEQALKSIQDDVRKHLEEIFDKDQAEIEFNKIIWPQFMGAKAGTGTGNKVERNQLMLADYERGRIVHVIGTHEVLERALKRFPNDPLDLADAAYWSWNDLTNSPGWVNFANSKLEQHKKEQEIK